MRPRAGIEQALYAAVIAQEMSNARATDNSDMERAIDQAGWIVECYRQAVREGKVRRG